jgi:hypothetical protein
MASKDLKIAYINPTNGRQKSKPIEVLFNPAEYTLERGNTYQSTSLPGLATPVTQFVTGNADTLSMELFFDTYARSSRHSNVQQGEDVRKYTSKLAALLDVDSTLHAPPIVQFIWGPPIGSPVGFQFTAIIEKLTQKFTLFDSDGVPLRATLNVTFKEYKTVQDQLEEIGRQSADRTELVVATEGTPLWAHAYEAFGDPAQWRVIAAQNGLPNPRILEPGTELEVPPLA